MAEEKIALLTSTRPLRHRVMEVGREVEKLDPARCMLLAQQFDVIIIGSRASDEFFQRIQRALSHRIRGKFRFYSRSFFNRFTQTHVLTGRADDRDEGWKEILHANQITFLPEITDDSAVHHKERKFRWTRLELFVTDKRVTVIRSGSPLPDES